MIRTDAEVLVNKTQSDNSSICMRNDRHTMIILNLTVILRCLFVCIHLVALHSIFNSPSIHSIELWKCTLHIVYVMHSKPIKILAKSVFRVGSWFYPVMSRPQEYLSLARVHQRLKNHIKISVYSLDHKNCMPNNLIAIICLSKVWQPQYVFRRMRWKERKNEIGKKNEMESECKKKWLRASSAMLYLHSTAPMK